MSRIVIPPPAGAMEPDIGARAISTNDVHHPLGPKRRAYLEHPPAQRIFAPAAQDMERYHQAVAEWQAVCDDMDAAEAEALEHFAPGLCELSQYWLQQSAGLCLELPCRCAYHSACTAFSFVCCWSAPSSIACDPQGLMVRHHLEALQLYYSLPRLLLTNLCMRPLAPWYVYDAEVGLIRPPKPPPPPDPCCDSQQHCCECCESDCDCCCERIKYLVNRKLRSLLASYSGVHAFHPSTCCGPCPCVKWRSAAEGPFANLNPPKLARSEASFERWVVCMGGSSSCELESAAARYARWDDEYDATRRRRTETFYAHRAEVPDGVPLDESDAAGVQGRVGSLHSFRSLLLSHLWPDRKSPSNTGAGDGLKAGHSSDLHGAALDHEESNPYVALGEPPSSPLMAEADSHACEKVQGRLCSAAMLSCCCAGIVLAANGGVGFYPPPCHLPL